MHHTGYVLRQLKIAARGTMRIDNRQQNGIDGVHQARVTMPGDPQTYRLILAPIEAPIELYGKPIGDCFALPLGAG